jgi:ribulose-5-phosphate 4-epimerase/fuculose-1-phosphate aldolase
VPTPPWRPRPGALLPEMPPEMDVVLLCRTLWHEGFDDHLGGHVTIRQADGTLLTNPWPLLWNEFGPDDVVRIDEDGTVLEGRWTPAPGVRLHIALHKARPGVNVAVHHHPRFATLWANAQRIPPILDQTSGLGGGEVTIVREYRGTVAVDDAARIAVADMGDADIALLAGHGLFVLGDDLARAHLRAVCFEHRCRQAYQVEVLGGGPSLDGEVAEVLGRAAFDGFWEAMARQELRRDPSLLGGTPDG